MKIEIITFIELNILARRYFLSYLFNTFIDKSIRTIFSEIKIDYYIYKKSKFRV